MGVKFFKENIYDLTNTIPVTTVTDSVATDAGEDFILYLRNRENRTAWITTGSSDLGNTTIEIDFIDARTFNNILLIKHNFKAYTIQYWNGSAWVDFSTAISETTYNKTSSLHTFNTVVSQKIKLIITGTQVANSDKYMYQLIVTDQLGEFTIEPKISPTISKDKKVTKFLSGKSFVAKSIGGFSATLEHPSVSNNSDLTLIETLYEQFKGFLFYPSGGTLTQFETTRIGWSLEDIYFVAPTNDYEPEWFDGFYKNGIPLNMKIVEVN